MARPKSFDVDKVLDAAVCCFWRDGMKAASIRTLAEEMGIAGPSLYNAFGCKRRLFAQALDRYVSSVMHTHLAQLEADYGPAEAIQTFFDEFIERLTKETEPTGCLLLKAASELEAEDTEMRQLVCGHLDDLAAFFKRNWQAAHAGEAAPSRLAADDVAQMLLGVTLGMHCLAQSGAERKGLEAVLRPVLSILDNPTS